MCVCIFNLNEESHQKRKPSKGDTEGWLSKMSISYNVLTYVDNCWIVVVLHSVGIVAMVRTMEGRSLEWCSHQLQKTHQVLLEELFFLLVCVCYAVWYCMKALRRLVSFYFVFLLTALELNLHVLWKAYYGRRMWCWPEGRSKLMLRMSLLPWFKSWCRIIWGINSNQLCIK